jgi:hypothetical protein
MRHLAPLWQSLIFCLVSISFVKRLLSNNKDEIMYQEEILCQPKCRARRRKGAFLVRPGRISISPHDRHLKNFVVK